MTEPTENLIEYMRQQPRESLGERNLMVSHSGALGDAVYMNPALSVLRTEFDNIWVCGRLANKQALGGTGLVDRFIVKTKDFSTWGGHFQRQWLKRQVEGFNFDARITVRGFVPSIYVFKEEDPNYGRPVEWKRKQNLLPDGTPVNYLDETSRGMGVPDAVGKHPVTRISLSERRWLRDFRRMNDVPENAFLLGWQLHGSGHNKYYPHFEQVVQRGIMAKYPEVYLLLLGDLSGDMRWDTKSHGGRFINPGSDLTFRQAYLLTSILDCFVSPDTGVFIASQCFPDVPKILLATHTLGEHVVCKGNDVTVIQTEARCAPCYNIIGAKCPEARDDLILPCTRQIRPSRVINAIEEVIGKWLLARL